jgi:hypothetical protein
VVEARRRIAGMRLGRSILVLSMLAAAALQGCAPANVPGARSVNIPAAAAAEERHDAVNERPDPIMYLPLGNDVLTPSVSGDDPMPNDYVGPFELRGETLAGALQLILADYDVSLAFQTNEGLTRRITVANLRGPLSEVVRDVCSLANLYCAYSHGMLTVKDTQTFTVHIPPLSQDTAFMTNVAAGLTAIIGKAPVVDPSTRTIIYEATQRNAEMAERYFQRMRSSTALIIFETYIWEVQLDAGNSTGIKWDQLLKFGKYTSSFGVAGAVGADFTNPISIGLPTSTNLTPANIFQFLSTFGAVKTISQPQITVLAGSQAKLRAANTQNYVAQVAETIDSGQSTTSVNTSSVDTGFTLKIGSAWDNATVYADINIVLSDVSSIQDFNFSTGSGGATTVQLPMTTERELDTQVRIRPGDSLLLGGLVRENDNFASQGLGFMKPFLPTSRTATTENLELVFLLRPRVVVFTSPTDPQYNASVKAGAPADAGFHYDFAPLKGGNALTAPANSPAPLPAAPPVPVTATTTTTTTTTGAPVSASADSTTPVVPIAPLPPPVPAGTPMPLLHSSASGAPMPLGGSISSDALNPGSISQAP